MFINFNINQFVKFLFPSLAPESLATNIGRLEKHGLGNNGVNSSGHLDLVGKIKRNKFPKTLSLHKSNNRHRLNTRPKYLRTSLTSE